MIAFISLLLDAFVRACIFASALIVMQVRCCAAALQVVQALPPNGEVLLAGYIMTLSAVLPVRSPALLVSGVVCCRMFPGTPCRLGRRHAASQEPCCCCAGWQQVHPALTRQLQVHSARQAASVLPVSSCGWAEGCTKIVTTAASDAREDWG